MIGSVIVTPGGSSGAVIFQPQYRGQVIITEPGPAGPPGDPDQIVTAAAPLSGLIVVKGALASTPCDAGTAEDGEYAIGVTLAAVTAQNQVRVRRFGLLTDPSFNFLPGSPVFCGGNGLLTQVFPSQPTSAFLLRIGVAQSPTSLFIDIQPAVSLA